MSPQAPHEHAVPDDVLPVRRQTFVVEAVAGELSRIRGVEGDVQQLGPVAVAAEHVGGDEAGARVVAFVAQDAVQLQRVADGLVHLENELVRGQQHIHGAGGAIGRRQELQGFLRQNRRRAPEPGLVQHLDAALAAEAPAAEGTAHRLGTVVGGTAQGRHQLAQRLVDAGAVSGQIKGLGLRMPQRGVPVHDARVRVQAFALGAKEVDLVAQRHRIPRDRHRSPVFTPACFLERRGREIHDAARRGPASPVPGAAQGPPKPLRAQVAGTRVTEPVAVNHGNHDTGVIPRCNGFQHVASYGELFGTFADIAERAEADLGRGFAEPCFKAFRQHRHGASPGMCTGNDRVPAHEYLVNFISRRRGRIKQQHRQTRPSRPLD